MIGDDAAYQIVFGFLAIFERRGIIGLHRQDAIGDIDRLLIFAGVVTFGESGQQFIQRRRLEVPLSAGGLGRFALLCVRAKRSRRARCTTRAPRSMVHS